MHVKYIPLWSREESGFWTSSNLCTNHPRVSRIPMGEVLYIGLGYIMWIYSEFVGSSFYKRYLVNTSSLGCLHALGIFKLYLFLMPWIALTLLRTYVGGWDTTMEGGIEPSSGVWKKAEVALVDSEKKFFLKYIDPKMEKRLWRSKRQSKKSHLSSLSVRLSVWLNVCRARASVWCSRTLVKWKWKQKWKKEAKVEKSESKIDFYPHARILVWCSRQKWQCQWKLQWKCNNQQRFEQAFSLLNDLDACSHCIVWA